MAMERFEGSFHQSDLKAYLKCPRSFYYNRVLGLDREKISLANLGGRAGHSTLERSHLTGEWDPEEMFNYFLVALDYEKQQAVGEGLEVHGNLDPERYRTMFREYAARPWNTQARVIAAETTFTFTIKPSKTEYRFRGRIDQLVEIPVSLLVSEFPVFAEFPRETVIMHRDTKFGRRKECSRFELALDVQFDVYSYAFSQGQWWLTDSEDPVQLPVPDVHCKYFMEDHIPYESDAGPYLKDPETGGRVPCDLVPEPCLVGKTQKACEGKRSWCTKQRRGPGMYFTDRTPARLELIPSELGRVCASIRMGHYPRQLGELCFNYCQFRSICEAEILSGEPFEVGQQQIQAA